MNEFFPEGILINTPENAEYSSGIRGLEKAMVKKKILEARAILCNSENELVFDLGGVRGIMKKEDVCLLPEGEAVRDIAVITRVGKPCAFTVESIGYSGDLPVARLSRKAAQEICLEEYLDKKETGDVIDARVTHFEPFGCFCDIGCGIISLLSIDCISVSRISHPRDRFRIGQYIHCAVRGRDGVILGHRGRIALTHKELLGTWDENAARFSVGQTVVGIIRSVESYGIFIELAPNLAGLAEWRGDVLPGQCCSVYIKNIIPSKMKIKLVLIEAFGGDRSEIRTEYFITSGNVRDFVYEPETKRALADKNI